MFRHAGCNNGYGPRQFCCSLGAVCCWHATAHAGHEETKVHSAPVTTLLWGRTNTHVLGSGDSKGRVALWHLEQPCKLALLSTFDGLGPVM